jgi:hypothetical protein
VLAVPALVMLWYLRAAVQSLELPAAGTRMADD